LIGSTATPSRLIEGAGSRSGRSGGGGDLVWPSPPRRRSPAVVDTWLRLTTPAGPDPTASDQLLLLLHLLAATVVTGYC
jgi:hypothetical protein